GEVGVVIDPMHFADDLDIVRTDGPGLDYLLQPLNKLLRSIGIELVMVHYPKLWTPSVGRQPDLLRIISSRYQGHGLLHYLDLGAFRRLNDLRDAVQPKTSHPFQLTFQRGPQVVR